jgi:two-component system, OmpR family, KDP operon response regulator KdpE
VAKVLVVDDDAALLRALRLALAHGGHEVLTAATGEQGLQETALSTPDVVIVDLGLPDLDGAEVCRRIREWSDVPIVVLSAADDEARKVAALDAGADDYVTKPFGMAELEARLRALVRRRQTPEDEAPHEIVLGNLTVDLVHRQAKLDETDLGLTAREFDLLAYLARHHDRLCTHRMLLEALWGSTSVRQTQYLHTYVHRLRDKLDHTAAVHIETAPGIGYILSIGPATPD